MKTQKDIDAFLERVGKRLSERPRASHSGKHRAAFNALRPLIEATLRQGYTMMATWEALREENELSMSYETFRTHCRRAGIAQDASRAAPTMHPLRSSPRPVGAEAASSTAAPTEATERGFRHERVPRKKDIYG